MLTTDTRWHERPRLQLDDAGGCEEYRGPDRVEGFSRPNGGSGEERGDIPQGGMSQTAQWASEATL